MDDLGIVIPTLATDTAIHCQRHPVSGGGQSATGPAAGRVEALPQPGGAVATAAR